MPQPSPEIAARPAPARAGGFGATVRRAWFGGWLHSLTSLALLAAAIFWLPPLADWALWQALWQADAPSCQAARGSGACWAMLAEKYRFILLGRYPQEEGWRPVLATGLLLALIIASGLRRCWSRWLLLAWVRFLLVRWVR